MHTFVDTEGYEPESGLVQGADGNLYGTTYGGTAPNEENDDGSVFRISTNGPGFALSNLVSFFNTNGSEPLGTLVQGPDGFFYGTTSEGGANSGSGTIFRMSASGALAVLYSFSAGTDGGEPDDGVILGRDGYLYGTANDGGEDGVGTVFRMATNPPYTFTTMHFFAYTDGGYPEGALVQGKDGDLYGTTMMGGADGDGVVFRLSTNGPEFAYTLLYSFTGGNDGSNPHSGLIQGSDGFLYGTTTMGGADGDGVIFRISTRFRTSFRPVFRATFSAVSTLFCP